MCVCIVHLKERLEDYIKQWNGLVKLFRNDKREGLIQARSIGAKKATKGQVSYDVTATASILLLLTQLQLQVCECFISGFTRLQKFTHSF